MHYERFSHSLLAALVLGSTSFALQSGWSSKTVVDLGTYRVATGEWIALPGSGLLNPADSIYDNTCMRGSAALTVAFGGMDQVLVDSGQIPGSDNTLLMFDAGQLHDAYRVQGWRMAIAPSEPEVVGGPGPISATMFWWNCLDSCVLGGSSVGLMPTASITIDGIPGGGSTNSCFVFDVDITGTALEFVLTGDCDGVFDGPDAGAVGDTFGYGITVQRTDGMPLSSVVSVGLGGDPGTQTSGFGCQLADGSAGPGGFIGESTSFLNPTRAADSSTGFGNIDDAMDAIGGGVPGCFSFGYFVGLPGIPYVGLFHELYGVPVFESSFAEFCQGDGGNQMGCTNCPCGNNAAPGSPGGCLNSAGFAARLEGSGTPSLSADTLRFEMKGATPGSFTVLISGDRVAPGNMVNPCFGMMSGVQANDYDGLRCSVGAFRRHGGRPTDANGDAGKTSNGWGPPNGPQVGLAAQGGFAAGQTRFFQAIYREFSTLGCTRGLNTSQAVRVLFMP